MEKDNNPQNKTVFVIVRETKETKTKLEDLSRDGGFSTLSDYIRHMWRKLIK